MRVCLKSSHIHMHIEIYKKIKHKLIITTFFRISQNGGYPLTGEWHRSMPFRTFFEKKLRFHRNSKNEVMRISRMCSTHKTDFKTSNFYNKIPSRIQIRVA